MQYTEKVMDHFHNPRNVGKIENPDGVGQVGNPACGDIMKIYLKIGINKDEKEYIEDISFQTFGCGAAIASSSMLTETAKGKTLEELLSKGINDRDRIANLKKELIDSLGGLPAIKEHCSVLASDGLYVAIRDYYEKQEKK